MLTCHLLGQLAFLASKSALWDSLAGLTFMDKCPVKAAHTLLSLMEAFCLL